jgi:4'-phosphopantetheinyl transferase
MLRIVLATYTGTSAGELQFHTGEHGKPALGAPSESSGPQFNATHSDGWAMVAVARDSPVGVDLEAVRDLHDFEGMAARCLTARERSQFDAICTSADQKTELFLRCWVAKEAGLKARGRGLSDPLESVPLSFDGSRPILAPSAASAGDSLKVVGLSPFAGCVGAVAWLGAEKRLRFFRFPEFFATD